MAMLQKIQSFLSGTADSLASLTKVLLMSRPLTRLPKQSPEKPLIILGNGPSLNRTIENHPDFLTGKDLLAVNFFANSPIFSRLRPSLYVLADPHFFFPKGDEAKVRSLWQNIASADWPLTLLVPANYLRRAKELLKEGQTGNNCNLLLMTFNLTPVAGFGPLKRALYRTGAGMPRPRNVLIPAIMSTIRMGYREIFIAGADHSWSKTLWVDDANRVVTVQPHFYPDDEKERERVTDAYAGIHLHDIFNSFAVAFRSYFEIADFAGRSGVKIINITPDSFIDAFPRMKL